jgi:hypothetical protein
MPLGRWHSLPKDPGPIDAAKEIWRAWAAQKLKNAAGNPTDDERKNEAKLDKLRKYVAFHSPVLKSNKRVGRPRQDELRKRIEELRAENKSWEKVRRQLNKETGKNRTANAYRNLVSERKSKK